ncbi:hypothetical protein ACHHYP_04192 [Achlya hypogyna]|uniref:Uncharacterized protein n=1 Tax=Achlya hypogyna TaxID=1202772 RepID=A0A1V9Z294_ACHHY|nr:hypothetical protein ACHHYP_04192 [Achlya hypogyna]
MGSRSDPDLLACLRERPRRAFTAAAARNISAISRRHEDLETEFGFGCNVDEHIKYGKCLDGQCMQRKGWEIDKLHVGAQKFLEKDRSLHQACLTRNALAAQHLLRMRPDLTARNAEGQTALHVACKVGALSLVEHILAHAASPDCLVPIDMNAQDRSGNTCLHAAAAANHFGIVQRIVASGGEWSVTNHAGQIAADVAGSDQRIFYLLRQLAAAHDLEDKVHDNDDWLH